MKLTCTLMMLIGVSFAAPVFAADGKAVYDKDCALCHNAGVGGAPKLGDKAAWAPRISKGMPALYDVAEKGKPGTPMTGFPALPKADLKAAVDFMVAGSK